MKTRKLAKALLSVALVIAMLFSMCIVGFVSASAAGLELNYEFAYQNAGYAEGRLSLSGTSGTYILYWSDDTSALKGYSGIAQITVASTKKYFNMPANTAIPAGATKVIAVESGKEATVANASAVFDIPADKQFNGGVKQYTFEALSDIHIQVDNSYWTLSKTHFANALEVAAKRDVDFMTISGDMVNGYSLSNLKAEYPQYLELIAKSNYNNPIYETNGNHEMKGGSNAENLALYKQYTGLNSTTGAVQSNPYYEKTINGDHYIFLVLELSGSPNESSEFTTAQLDWFEGLLKKYSGDGHKIIVNQHALIRGYGAGDNKVTPYYGGALRQDYAEVKRLMSLMEQYPDIIMMNGHSHIDFKYGYNFDNENGKTCYTVHIPSTSSTTHPNSSGTTDYIMDVNSSQGYLVDVYDDYVILNGTDLAFNLICPSYVYMVDYTGETLVKNELEDIVYETVTITVDVSNLTDAPQSVVCVAVDESNAANNQSIAMTRNSDGTYSAKVNSEFSSVYFAINGATGVKTSAFPVANCKIILGHQKLTYTPTGSVTSNVHAHVWGAGGDGTTWPGVPMTQGSDGNYTVYVPASQFTGVVFNTGSGGAQTTDLVFSDYASDFIEDIYINLDGDEDPTTPATTPTQEPTVAPTTAPTEPQTTVATEPTEPTTVEPTEPTEPAKDPLAPIVVVEETEDSYLLVDAYPANGSEGVEFKFAVSGRVVQDYSAKSDCIFGVGGDGMYILEVYAKYADGSEHKTTVMIEVKNGEIILPEMPERPTAPATSEPTEPATSTPDETVPTTTTEPAVEYIYGDADLNGKVNVKDATTVQKYAAKLIELDETAFAQADVTGDSKVNVKDATAIQKLVAKLIDKFPVEEQTELVAVGANSTLMSEVKTVLSKEYQYASYDAYMALKKAYMNNVTDAELTTAYNNYKTMKSNNALANPGGVANIGDIDIGQTGQGSPTLPGPSIGGGNNNNDNNDNNDNGGNSGGDVTTETITIHVKPDASWTGAYIYGFYGEVGVAATDEPLGAYPGTAMTSEGDGWYKAEVPADIDYIKFTDGTGSTGANNRTDNIANSVLADEVTFTITAKGSKYWNYTVGSAITPPDDNTDDNGGNSEGDTTTYTVYAINSAKWDTMVAHAWNTGGSGTTWPGTVMTKTGSQVNGFDVYSVSFDKEYGNVIFNNNDNGAKTADLTFETGQYFDVKGGKWYTSLDDVPAVSAASTDRYLVGEFNSWSTTANEFMSEDGTVGYVELELAANTTYEFKIVREGTWTSCKDTLSITDTVSGLTFSSSVEGNTTITTKSAGTYVFAFGISTSQLSVTYPA